ncbi:uncharacterized protein LOC126209842 [Schistocerca nitens]|uniref:uncharacterized protein LOC126209842 n=1 Tax=Schistocerca nitens TaxID=7011 RepID=UPI002119B1A2|nr:uncharacterized protein LOC126209842 [Schistocerca nitens]
MNGAYGDKTNAIDEDVKMESPEKISQKRLMDGSDNEQHRGRFYKMLRVDAEGSSGRHFTVTPRHHNAAVAHADTSIVPVIKPNTVAEMALMHRCCCGCTLRMGTTIIAILFVSLSFVQIGTSVYYLLIYQDIDDGVNRGELATMGKQLLTVEDINAYNALMDLLEQEEDTFGGLDSDEDRNFFEIQEPSSTEESVEDDDLTHGSSSNANILLEWL